MFSLNPTLPSLILFSFSLLNRNKTPEHELDNPQLSPAQQTALRAALSLSGGLRVPVPACPPPDHPGGTGSRGSSTRGRCLQCRIPWLRGQNLQTQRCFCARLSWHRAAPWGRCSVPRGGTGRPGLALALLLSCWEFNFGASFRAVCSLLWDFLRVETSLGVFPFIV